MTAPVRAALALLLLLTASTFEARAGQSEAERQSRRSFQSAETHFRAGRFAEALADYQSGYDKVPLPGFLINIAQCQRRLGDLQKARTTYQKFVMVAPDSPHVPEVKTLIAELDKLIADLEDRKSPDSEEPAAATTPAPAAAPVPAAIPPPAASVATPVLVASPAPEPEPSARPAKTRWWLWGLVGAAVAGGAVSAYALTASPSTTTVHEGSLGTLRR